ncbi:MAG: tetrahydromethanopterin S-methyltransferase subunit B [Arcobacteraceae bacterium]|nr:tetrahydromethanopterin S-methyltransferase subunit B [Arcobacteraceae bacterium]
MSLKQAKEIADRLELAELSLNHLLANVEKSTKAFEETLSQQKQIMNAMPTTDKKLNNMKILVGINFGFVLGLLVSKFLI